MEILVVLAIMGVILSVVSVRLVGTIDSAYFNRTADAVMADILLLRAEALLQGESRILITDNSRVETLSQTQKKRLRRFNLPQGWGVEGEPITISHTGTCFGGQIVIANDEGRRAIYSLSPPKCEAARSIQAIEQNNSLYEGGSFNASVQALERP